jgi:hypothetical protein
MVRFFLLLLLSQILAANEEGLQLESSKLVYLSYDQFPEKIYNGQVYKAVIKTVVTEDSSEGVYLKANSTASVKLLHQDENRLKNSYATFDTFYFQATGSTVSTPSFDASIVAQDYSGAYKETLEGKTVQTITLQPNTNYCNIIATSLTLENYKTKIYDDKHNVVVFSLVSEMANLKDFYLNEITNQGIESITQSWPQNRLTYIAVIPSYWQSLSFNFFNSTTSRFETINIPIIVRDDRVSTQTDLAPVQKQHTQIKIIAATIIISSLIIIMLLRRRLRYIWLILPPAIYVANLILPNEIICIEKDSYIYLLPMKNGTVFRQTAQNEYMELLGETTTYKKVKVNDVQIGWVKNENICTN